MTEVSHPLLRDYAELFVADCHFGDNRAAQTRGYGGSAAGIREHDLKGVFSLVTGIVSAAMDRPGVAVRLHVLGDISSGRKVEDTEHALRMFHRVRELVDEEVPGTELVLALYPGNHDSCSQMQPWGMDRRESFLRSGGGPFDVVSDHAVMRLQIPDGTHQDVLLAHLPYWRIGDGVIRHTRHLERSARYEQWRLPDLGLPMIHGHTHDTAAHIEHEDGIDLSAMCVSRDAWPDTGFATLSDVHDWILAWKQASTPMQEKGARALPERQYYDWRTRSVED